MGFLLLWNHSAWNSKSLCMRVFFDEVTTALEIQFINAPRWKQVYSGENFTFRTNQFAFWKQAVNLQNFQFSFGRSSDLFTTEDYFLRRPPAGLSKCSHEPDQEACPSRMEIIIIAIKLASNEGTLGRI